MVDISCTPHYFLGNKHVMIDVILDTVLQYRYVLYLISSTIKILKLVRHNTEVYPGCKRDPGIARCVAFPDPRLAGISTLFYY